MNPILLSVIIVASIGALSGIGLSIASVLLDVPVDEKQQAVLAALPGANCGACGFSGCTGYAAALAGAAAENGLCSPGGEQTAKAIAGILGLNAERMDYKTAVVRCLGTLDHTSNKMEYEGLRSCAAAMQHFGGFGNCEYGCIGLGDCAAVCEYGAVTLCGGIALINPALCKGCSKCVSACPKKIITFVPLKKASAVLCANRDKGGETAGVCKAGCIGCMRCVKACEYGAIEVNEFLARIDPHKCVGCGKCSRVCPSQCIGTIPPTSCLL